MREKLVEYLSSVPVVSIVDLDLRSSNFVRLNLADTNPRLTAVDVGDIAALEEFIASEIESAGGSYGIGGYDEDRRWYLRSPVFTTEEEPRTIHLGVDIWIPVGSPVYSSLAGEIHSFHDNSSYGDYGPTLITKHSYSDGEFFLLYGHLSRASIARLTPGQVIGAGEKIAELGDSTENGCWPSHLHFQIVRRLGGMKGDYPGVARASERSWYLKNCPDPNLLLRCEVLK